MTCPKCGTKPKAIKSELTTEGHARLLECQEHGRFWSLERLWKWVIKVAGNGRATAVQPLDNGSPTAIPVAEPLGGIMGGSDSDLPSGSDPNQSFLDSPNRARALRKGRGDAKKYPPEFEAIWDGCVPHTGNKHAAFKQWSKDKPNPTLTISVYLEWAETDSWQRGYIPHLRKWLHDRGWETHPSDADLSGPTAIAPKPFVPIAVAAERSRSERILNDKLKRLQAEENPRPVVDPRAEYLASLGGRK